MMKALSFLMFFWLTGFSCFGANQYQPLNLKYTDSILSTFGLYLLSSQKLAGLNFPNLTGSIYTKHAFQNIWFNQEKGELWETAMKTLHCVTQYGLNPNDYHLKDLTYGKIALADDVERKNIDILLTDAILTLMVHLHHGRLNPNASIAEIDDENYIGFRVVDVLQQALLNPDYFEEQITSVQPQNKGYQLLQNRLRELTVDKGNCEPITKDTLQLIALNLERYRWNIVAENETYIEINIPSFMLTLFHSGVEQSFKVVVGKPSNSTPSLSGRIDYLTTAPDWNVPGSIFKKEFLPEILDDPGVLNQKNLSIFSQEGQLIKPTWANLEKVRSNPDYYFIRQSPGRKNSLGQIVFYFNNSYSVFLHDTPERSFFSLSNRALSHGCIRLENPAKFTSLLLNLDSASPVDSLLVIKSMQAYKRYRYVFKKPVPIVIRYITCEIKNGVLVKYPDIYKRDKTLAAALFE